jgi:hypothetical protein
MTAATITSWSKKKEKLKRRYPFLTDNDMKYSEGQEKAMLGILGNKLGKTEQELLNIIVWL